MKLANIKKNKLSAILLDKPPGLTFESNAAKPSPESIVIAIECLIIPKTKGSIPINLAGITFATVLIGLLPFVLGMIKHSTAITMLTGLGLAALLSNASPGSLSNNIADNLFFLIFASFISLMITSFSIFNISRQDISIK